LIVNGFLSYDFNVYFGIKQGYPCVPFLFLTAIELITYNIKNSHIDIWLIEAKLTYKGYLNDTCYVYTNYHKLKKMFETFAFYKEVFCLKLNENKSSIIFLRTCIGMLKPLDILYKWYIPNDIK
jgi:hypothetical protein